jgi:hypothetical protein
MVHHVALVRTDVSEELSASIMMVTRIGEPGKPLDVTANVVPSSPIFITLIMETVRSSETSGLTRATRHDIQKTPFFIVTPVKT